MDIKTSFKIGALAASIALAMGSTAMAATTAPATTQLPGKGAVSGTGTVTPGTITSGVQTLTISGDEVINWGSGSDVNATGTGGFNIGSGAALHFAGTASDAVLNIDSSGNASQIFGVLDDNGGSGTQIFVANSNGVIVGAGATVSGNVSLIANKLSPTAAVDFAADPTTLAYNGTGGDVTVQKGASLGGTIFISGGGNVNVDLGAVNGASVSLNAGLSSSNAGSFATSNTAAALNVTGAIGEGNVTGFNSAGTASNAGELNISGLSGSAYSVGGTLTNTGILILPGTNGAVHNQGQLTTYGDTTFNGGLTNDGTYTTGGNLTVNGGDLANNGTLTGADEVEVYDGSIINKGSLSGTSYLYTYSDANYTAGADYSITNSGSISEGNDGGIYAFANQGSGHYSDAGNDTTGSFTNTGTLMLGGSGSGLEVYANDNITFGGAIKVAGTANSATNPFSYLDIEAYDGSVTTGKLTLTTPVTVTDTAYFVGKQDAIMANVTSLGLYTGTESSHNYVEVDGGDKLADDYAIRIGGGVTLSGPKVVVDGYNDPDHPNVILQGTLSGNVVWLGYNDGLNYAVSDVFSGPNGKIVLTDDANGDKPRLIVDFTGKVKAAPYLNDANFRFNYLPVTVDDSTQTAYVEIDPDGYQAAGTPDAAVNILVNGSVELASYGKENVDTAGPYVPGDGTGSAVTGVTVIPNTHLVLQSTGNIQVDGDDSGTFYWPGYIYLGNIASNADGSAAPGTLGYGTITLNGNFNNVLPGDTSGAGGIHFITQYPLQMGSYTVTTNANSWVNFGTDQLTAAYAAGAQGAGQFFGGVQGSGNVVNYGDLDPSLFHTQAPVSTK